MTGQNQMNTFEALQKFVDAQNEFNEAFECLKKSAEISLILDGKNCVLKTVDNRVKLLQEEAKKADVQFTLSSAAANALSQTKPQNMGQLGIEVLKLVAAQEIQIQVIGKVFSVLTGGYLGIVKKAGPEFMTFLGSKGFKSVTKITQAIKKMKAN